MLGSFSSFTTPRALLGLLAHAATHKRAETRGAVRKFTAKAVTDGVPLSAEAYRKYAKNHTGTDTMARHILRARIEQSDMYEYNPHAYTTDPCDPAYSGDINATLRLIQTFTLCVTARNFDLDSDGLIRRGDKIEIICKVNHDDTTNVQNAIISRVVERAQREDGTGTAPVCTGGLSGIFETQTVTVLGTTPPPDSTAIPDSTAPAGCGLGAEQTSSDSPDVLYIGDSQMVGELGNALMAAAGAGNRIAKSSTRFEYWTDAGQDFQGDCGVIDGASILREELAKGPKKIVISLGDNGEVSATGLSDLIALIKTAPGSPKVIWSGSSPPIYMPQGSSFSYLTIEGGDGNYGYKDHYNDRKALNERIKAAVTAAGWTFLDPYEYLKLPDGTSGYENPSDGIHHTPASAQQYVAAISSQLN